jgi:hypothetical protein
MAALAHKMIRVVARVLFPVCNGETSSNSGKSQLQVACDVKARVCLQHLFLFRHCDFMIWLVDNPTSGNKTIFVPLGTGAGLPRFCA